ncbi:hypothetical protein M427DRAFT_275936 [Gonapodya prolifera JEL478]|uniref:FAD-binding domain-containing protein n=1 Tax=Gonapodya prolifera (strain JEL478) TaxID=1344416 RepID=A0A139AYM5_GONPJ|nr:hypothetical protein M427DRAFT_275936 [Gonapodya prolifera JEL478]|eukprot:KXS21663.1 hypothetical protein M427DRAFT_275936 [Gonapodya prolifera JEL478]
MLNRSGTSKAMYLMLMDGSDRIRQNFANHDGELSKDVQILRSSYNRILMSRCSKAGIPFHANKCVAEVQQTETQVTVTFTDGTTATGDFLIAADGINSKLRTLLFPEEKPVQRSGIGFVGLFDQGFQPSPDIPPLRLENTEPAAYLNPYVGAVISV